MADINRLAVLVNLAGDVSALANQLNLDSSIIETAIYSGAGALSRNDDLELTEKMSRFERTELDDFQKAELQDFVDNVDNLESVIDDFRNGDTMRAAIADNNLELTDLETAFLLFGNAYTTLNIQNKLIDFLNTDSEYNKDMFLRMFELDGYHLSDIKDSHFWALYREVFYND